MCHIISMKPTFIQLICSFAEHTEIDAFKAFLAQSLSHTVQHHRYRYKYIQIKMYARCALDL